MTQKTDQARLEATKQPDTPTAASGSPFSATLRDFRAKLGWTQGQTAQWLGMSPRAYEYWESSDPKRVPNRVSQAGAYYLLTLACKK